jgi:hypothetical protein
VGREALKALQALKALKALKVLRLQVVKGVGEMDKMAEDSLRCPITTLQGFLQHGTLPHQIRLGIILSGGEFAEKAGGVCLGDPSPP